MAFVFITLATLGYPRTNRTGRGHSIILAVMAMATLRTIGFSAANLAAREAWAVVPMYATPVLGTAGAAWVAFGQGRRMARIADSIPVVKVDLSLVSPARIRRLVMESIDELMRGVGFGGGRAPR